MDNKNIAELMLLPLLVCAAGQLHYEVKTMAIRSDKDVGQKHSDLLRRLFKMWVYIRCH